jgi:hypothetical protein
MSISSNKSSRKLMVFLIAMFGIGFISWYFFQARGPHDGVVKRAESFFIEVRNDDNIFHAWLYDDNFKAIENLRVTGDVKFYQMDSTVFVVPLKPFLKDEFICESIPGYISSKVTFNITGVSVSATFQNQVQVVNEQP